MRYALEPYLGLIKTIIVGLMLGAAAYMIYNAGAESVRAEWQAEKLATTNAGRTLDDAIRAGVDLIAATAEDERKKAHAQNTVLRNDIRAGIVRLSVATRTSNPDSTGPQYIETRAELDPAHADRIVAIVNDGDDAIRDLNECVDKYGKVKEEVDAIRDKPRP